MPTKAELLEAAGPLLGLRKSPFKAKLLRIICGCETAEEAGGRVRQEIINIRSGNGGYAEGVGRAAEALFKILAPQGRAPIYQSQPQVSKVELFEKCLNCGGPIAFDLRDCPNCGTPVTDD